MRAIAAEVAATYQARVRLTGPVAMADEEFGTIKENAMRNGIITVAIVLLILWLALRSRKLIVAVLVNLIVGLAITAALGLAMVGAFNVISIYFAVLFVGIGVDFAIQFSVRYREERHRIGDLAAGGAQAPGRYVARRYARWRRPRGSSRSCRRTIEGISELGLIAGGGMLIAFVTSVTLLPALIALLKPPAEPERAGLSLAGAGRQLSRPARIPVIVGALGGDRLAARCSVAAFDDNPIDLRNPNSEAVGDLSRPAPGPATERRRHRGSGASLADADAAAKKLAKPAGSREHTHTIDVHSGRSGCEIAGNRAAATKLAGAFKAADAATPPTDAENVDALNEAPGVSPKPREPPRGRARERRNASRRRSALAKSDPEVREAGEAVMLDPLNVDLDDLRRPCRADL